MSKELDFYDGTDTIKYQDNSSVLKFAATENGVPFDLTRLDSMVIKIANDNGYLTEQAIDLSTISSPEQGKFDVKLKDDIIQRLVPDDYRMELWAQINPIQYDEYANYVNIKVDNEALEDRQAIFPSEGNLIMSVDDNIKSSASDVINAYPVDTVFSTVENWKNTATKIVQDALTKYLEAEIRTWQGDISTQLKNELVNDLMNKSNEIKDTIQNVLGHSLSEELTKQAGNIKTQLENDVRAEMIKEVADRLTDLKPIVENELHGKITAEVDSDITAWEQKTDTELNNKLAADIVDKTNTMQNSISTNLKGFLDSYFAKYVNDTNNDLQAYKDRIDADLDNFKSDVNNKFNTYKDETTNKLNSTLTSITDKAKEDLLNNIQDKFTNEDSQIRKDLSEQVKTTLTKQVDDSLHEMQVNGSIAVSKADFDNFVDKINGYVNSLKIASNINEIMDGMKNDLQSVKDDTAKLSSKIDDLFKTNGEIQNKIDNTVDHSFNQLSNNFNQSKEEINSKIEDLSQSTLSSQIKKAPTNNFDVNDYTDEGIYILNAPAYEHAPTDSMSGILKVYHAFDNIIQIFMNYAHSGRATDVDIYKRQYSYGGGKKWTDWNKLTSDKDIEHLSDKINDLSDKNLRFIRDLKSNEDLNNIRDKGIYTMNGGFFKNSPDPNKDMNGVIKVYPYLLGGSMPNIIQVAILFSYGDMSNKIYFRGPDSNNTSILGQWIQLSTNKDIENLDSKINDLSKHKKTKLDPAIYDFNDVTENGLYDPRQLSKNTPFDPQKGVFGFLQVFADENSDGICQFVYSTNANGVQGVYFRTAFANGPHSVHWTDWGKIPSKDYIDNKINEVESNSNKSLDQLHAQISSDFDNKISNLSEIKGTWTNDLTWIGDSPTGTYFVNTSSGLPNGFTGVGVAKLTRGDNDSYLEYIDSQNHKAHNHLIRSQKTWNGWSVETGVRVVNSASEASNVPNGTIAIIK